MNETNIVALEIGSSKIKGAVGVIDASGVITVQAVEEEPLLDWVRYGVVSNAEEVAYHASNLIDRLEQRCGGNTIEGVYVSIGGRSLRADSREKESILPSEMEITADIIEQLMSETAATVSASRELLDVVPCEYLVNKTRVLKPIGTLGNSVRMRSNVITCRQQLKRNLCHLLNEKLNLDVNGFEVRQLVQADFVLTPEEKRLGCMFVDCGAETTTVSIYKHGHLQYLATLPIGSRNITRDLTHLNFLEEQAEEIKRHYGNAQGTTPTQNAGALDIATINKYVSCRAGEIIANIKAQMKYAEFSASELPAGIILVGRGARLAGFSDRLSEASDMKVRFGNPVRTDVRVADPRISLSDSVDVIATLYAASRHNPLECMATTEPVEESHEETRVEQYVPEVEEQPEPKPVVKQPKRRGNSIFSRVRDRIDAILSEDDDFDEDDDAVLRDDD